jgi:hypothetical protein
MRRIRKLAGTAAATVALTAGLVLPATTPANALASKTFTWGTLRSGDCTMFENARWTVYSDGTARFDATVTSGDNNDAWLMWPRLKDANHAVLSGMKNANVQDRADWQKFIKNLPSSSQRYRWFASGRFDASKYHLIKHMSLKNHC